MDLLMLIFLFLVCVLLTIIVNILFRNRGPWENPMFFFLVLFLTSWTILLWTQPVETGSGEHPYLTVTALAVLISILLAATRTPTWRRDRVLTLDKKNLVNVITRPENIAPRKNPNAWFWGLITVETMLILFAYYLKFI